MRRLFFLLAAFCATAFSATAQTQSDECHLDVPCTLGDRSYHVKEPDGWDGTSPMPVLIHFHGWQRTGALPVQHQRISGATRRRGVLLIAPNGNRKTWNMWFSETEDVQFAADVLEDVIKRYPIDTENIFLSGYSYGSIMAWRVACDRGAEMNVRALLGISGTIGQSETCAQAPKEARHVHGLKDNVLDFPFGPNEETDYPVFLWRDRLACTDDATQVGDWSAVDFLTLTRTEWRDCANGTLVALDIHPGGHFIPHGWIARQLDELMGRDPVFP
ncbi:MAG: polyhydroxybutyrate depolymerase [Pseudomonadota bacterium]